MQFRSAACRARRRKARSARGSWREPAPLAQGAHAACQFPSDVNVTNLVEASTSKAGLPYPAVHSTLRVAVKRDSAGALTSLMNAVMNGLASVGTRCLDMPPVTYSVRQAIKAARNS
jgi:hypothetical protein